MWVEQTPKLYLWHIHSKNTTHKYNQNYNKTKEITSLRIRAISPEQHVCITLHRKLDTVKHCRMRWELWGGRRDWKGSNGLCCTWNLSVSFGLTSQALWSGSSSWSLSPSVLHSTQSAFTQWGVLGSVLFCTVITLAGMPYVLDAQTAEIEDGISKAQTILPDSLQGHHPNDTVAKLKKLVVLRTAYQIVWLLVFSLSPSKCHYLVPTPLNRKQTDR